MNKPFQKETTIKEFLRNRYHISRRTLTSLKKEGNILLNSKPVFVDHPLQQGDELMLIWPDEPVDYIKPEPIPLDIRYEDDFLLIVNKPAGLPVHPTMGYREGTLAGGVLYYMNKKGLRRKFRPINRLDRNTSGMMMVAKNQWIHQQFSRERKKKRLKRKYLAIVHGKWGNRGETGTINRPIARKKDSIIEREVSEDGKEAVTHWRVVESEEAYSLMEFQLETGRTHQIRVHAADAGHPLAGDDLYGGDSAHIDRQALHAYFIQFVHPVSRNLTKVSCEMPSDMDQLWKRFHKK
ncbi:MAG: RluA family pseudouridine synthase [Bacillaceae bacterium]|nr:RluA family pseudouridine synthase [Bacillaceae bacterium]